MTHLPLNDSAEAAERQRQAILQSYPTVDKDLKKRLDRLAAIAARACHTPVALVSLVGGQRQSFVGRFGLDVQGTPRGDSFCAHAMHLPEGMVVKDAREDPRFSDNPLVTGEMSIRFYAGKPLMSAEGSPLGSICVIDTVPRDEGLSREELEALDTVALSVMDLLEAQRSEQARRKFAQTSPEGLSNNEHSFTLLADAMPQLVWSTDAGGMADYFNRAWTEYIGEPLEASYGAGWLEFLHPEDRQLTDEVWKRAVETSSAYDTEYRLRKSEGEYRWFLARGLPVTDAAGAITRWIGTCTQIHDQKETERQLGLLSRELNHRINNIFAVIGGLVSLTFRDAREGKELARNLQDRIVALGRAHGYVRAHGAEGLGSSSSSTSLKGMLDVVLAPYSVNQDERIRIEGPDIAIDDRSATPLALFFHELATNATKYGALSVAEGRVVIEIESADTVSLTWRETDGPTVTPAAEEGFGARLVEMSIGGQLGGNVRYDWARDGVTIKAEIPPRMMTRSPAR